MEYTTAFEKAVDHAMKYEVGGFWELSESAINGEIDTPQSCRACGYTNDPTDNGGETKYGVASNANPDLDIATLDWEGAKRVYFKRYWLTGDCQNLPSRLAVLHFDGCVNHGVGRANKFLQMAVGATPDGDIGPATLALIAEQDENTICNKVCDQRENFYKAIVNKNPTQSTYLNGWLRRIHEMREFTLDPSNLFT